MRCDRQSRTPRYLVEYEEDVVKWHRGDEVEEEPGLQVVPGDELWVEDDLFGVVLLHDT